MSLSLNISSPLRYPGGKSRISTFLIDLILINNLEGKPFYELYAGGAGAALNLLFSDVVSNIVINDLDAHIYSFWNSVVNNPEGILKLIHDTPVNISSWNIQRNIYENHSKFTELEVGFSTFFLNRCNRSGILYKAGPIGGLDQMGNYKIDVRFNKEELSNRIKKIAHYASRITVTNFESIDFLRRITCNLDDKFFIFLDPPYYEQGENLYLNFYKHEDHERLRDILKKCQTKYWFLTYDNCPEINNLYFEFTRSELPMSYTLQAKRKSKEIMIFSNSLYLPRNLRIGSKLSPLNLKSTL